MGVENTRDSLDPVIGQDEMVNQYRELISDIARAVGDCTGRGDFEAYNFILASATLIFTEGKKKLAEVIGPDAKGR